MKKKTIEIEISPGGETKVTTSGFTGKECDAAAGPIEKALGVRREYCRTDEYYRKEQVKSDRRKA